MLCQMRIIYINFRTFDEYLQESEHGQIDGQDRQIKYSLIKKHFSTLLESVKKVDFFFPFSHIIFLEYLNTCRGHTYSDKL